MRELFVLPDDASCNALVVKLFIIDIFRVFYMILNNICGLSGVLYFIT